MLCVLPYYIGKLVYNNVAIFVWNSEDYLLCINIKPSLKNISPSGKDFMTKAIISTPISKLVKWYLSLWDLPFIYFSHCFCIHNYGLMMWKTHGIKSPYDMASPWIPCFVPSGYAVNISLVSGVQFAHILIANTSLSNAIHMENPEFWLMTELIIIICYLLYSTQFTSISGVLHNIHVTTIDHEDISHIIRDIIIIFSQAKHI